MSGMRQELEDSARKVFPTWEEARDAAMAWQHVTELGWLMAGVPEDLGGLGLEHADLGVIFAELGRALVPGPVVAQFLAIEALAGGDAIDGRTDLLERAMGGELLTASLAGPNKGLVAVPDADRAGYVLSRSAAEVALVSLEDAAVVAHETWDATRRLFDVTPAPGAQRIVLASGERAQALSQRLDAMLCLALAGDALGGAGAVLDMSIEYLRTRHQFGRPLAMFQALKHRAADLKCAIETSEALYRERCAGPADLPALGALKALCCELYKHVAEEAVQFHGGIGLTVEYPVHLFLKRAFLDRELGGSTDYWNECAGRAAIRSFGPVD